MKDDDDYELTIKRLDDEHRFQVTLFYDRFKIFLSIATILITGIIGLLVGGVGKIENNVLYFSVAVVSALGFTTSICWTWTLRVSLGWISYFFAKLIYTESRRLVKKTLPKQDSSKPARHDGFVYIDRVMQNPENVDDLHELTGLLSQSGVNRTSRELAKVWQDEVNVNGFGIPAIYLFIARAFACVFALIFLVCCSCWGLNCPLV